MNAVEIRNAHVTQEGAGAEVRRLFPIPAMMNFDPFVLWDHFSVGEDAGFPSHPHRGFEAITYMFSGGMEHADNLGNRSTVTAGGAQRFTAGRGIVHSEMPAPGGEARGIQLWINLPRTMKQVQPGYQQVDADELPVQVFEGGEVRTIVGEGSPVTLLTQVAYRDVTLQPGGVYREAIQQGHRGLVYVVDGAVTLDDVSLQAGQAAFVQDRESLALTASEPSRIMLALGRPHGEPIRQYGPFVD